jgi:uncharacterized protein (DUF362 family)
MNYQPRPRTVNKFMRDGKPLVVKVPHYNGDYLQESLHTAINQLGGLSESIRSGDRILLKPNFNCSFRYPLSTELGMLAAMIEVLKDSGAIVTVGEMCGRAAWPTDKVMTNLGVYPLLQRYGVPFINFQEDDWIAMEVPGKYWQVLHVPRSIYEAEKRVYLANMRCHSSARFSASLKLSVGFISPEDREILHSDKNKTEAMIAENNLGWQPDLVVVDGRRSTVSWHGRGAYIYPNVIMVSGDMVAVDSEAVKILKTFPERKSRIQMDLTDLDTLSIAQEHGLGSMDYKLVNVEGHERTEEEGNLDPAALAVENQL